ncbi:MAG: hypothetical protein R3A51_09760 [Nannocystaceae bacterium]
MDEAREQLLAGAVSGDTKTARLARGLLSGDLEGARMTWLVPVIERLVAAAAGRSWFGDERVTIEALADGRDDRGALERLGDEVVGAELHGRDRVLDGAVGGHDDDLDLGGDGLGRLEQILARHARHAQVGDHHVHRVVAEDLEGRLPARRGADLQPLLLQHLAEGFEDALLVVNDEDTRLVGRGDGHRSTRLPKTTVQDRGTEVLAVISVDYTFAPRPQNAQMSPRLAPRDILSGATTRSGSERPSRRC